MNISDAFFNSLKIKLRKKREIFFSYIESTIRLNGPREFMRE